MESPVVTEELVVDELTDSVVIGITEADGLAVVDNAFDSKLVTITT